MRPSPYPKAAHVFVCVNRRPSTDPLGAGCGERGEATFAALRSVVQSAGLSASVWTVRTYCLGVCPKSGCAAAIAPGGEVVTEVEPGDARSLLSLAVRAAQAKRG